MPGQAVDVGYRHRNNPQTLLILRGGVLLRKSRSGMVGSIIGKVALSDCFIAETAIRSSRSGLSSLRSERRHLTGTKRSTPISTSFSTSHSMRSACFVGATATVMQGCHTFGNPYDLRPLPPRHDDRRRQGGTYIGCLYRLRLRCRHRASAATHAQHVRSRRQGAPDLSQYQEHRNESYQFTIPSGSSTEAASLLFASECIS